MAALSCKSTYFSFTEEQGGFLSVSKSFVCLSPEWGHLSFLSCVRALHLLRRLSCTVWMWSRWFVHTSLLLWALFEFFCDCRLPIKRPGDLLCHYFSMDLADVQAYAIMAHYTVPGRLVPPGHSDSRRIGARWLPGHLCTPFLPWLTKLMFCHLQMCVLATRICKWIFFF